jgi:flagellar basal body-associated protein FliL
MAEELETARGAEDGSSPTPAAKKGGGGLIKLIIILVILGIAAGAGWFALPMIMPAPPDKEAEEKANTVAKAEGGEDEGLYNPENPPGVIEFAEPFLIRLRKPPGLMRGDVYLKVNLTLEVGSVEIQTEMASNEAVMSRISDTVITFLAGKFPEEVETPSWGKLKEDLQAMINSQFPEKYHIKRVNFREFVIQAR